MVELEADIRVVIRVPFTADVTPLEPEVIDKGNGRYGLAYPVAHEEAAATAELERAAAAVHAETVLVDRIRELLGDQGAVVAVVVEEVRER